MSHSHKAVSLALLWKNSRGVGSDGSSNFWPNGRMPRRFLTLALEEHSANAPLGRRAAGSRGGRRYTLSGGGKVVTTVFGREVGRRNLSGVLVPILLHLFFGADEADLQIPQWISRYPLKRRSDATTVGSCVLGSEVSPASRRIVGRTTLAVGRYPDNTKDPPDRPWRTPRMLVLHPKPTLGQIKDDHSLREGDARPRRPPQQR